MDNEPQAQPAEEGLSKVKSALEFAYICGLRTFGEAIANYSRSMQHIRYEDIPKERKNFSHQTIAAMRKIVDLDPTLSVRKVELLKLKRVNQLLELGVDFKALDDELEEEMRKADELAIIDENLDRQERDLYDIFSAEKKDQQ